MDGRAPLRYVCSMTEHLPPVMRATEVFGRRMRASRERKGWTQQQLAARLTELGQPMARATVAKIEGDLRDSLPLDEALAIAIALDEAPLQFLTPPEGFGMLVGGSTVKGDEVVDWLRGERPAKPLTLDDVRAFVDRAGGVLLFPGQGATVRPATVVVTAAIEVGAAQPITAAIEAG